MVCCLQNDGYGRMTTRELKVEADRITAILTADEAGLSKLRFDEVALLLQQLNQIQALQTEHLTNGNASD